MEDFFTSFWKYFLYGADAGGGFIAKNYPVRLHSGALRSGAIKTCAKTKGGSLSSTVFKIMK